MAKVVDTIERDGHRIAVYESGAEYDLDARMLVKPALHTMITSENVTVYNRRRQEKQAALLRRRIAETHNASMPNPTNTSAGAFAEAGAMLYEQVVLNTEAYPRDRMEAWEKLGKYAQVLPSDLKNSGETTITNNTVIIAGNDAIARAWADAMQIQDADVIDIRNDNESESE